MRAKTGVKLAYKHAFALIFTSDGHPMLLVRPWPGKKIPAVLNGCKENILRSGRCAYGVSEKPDTYEPV